MAVDQGAAGLRFEGRRRTVGTNVLLATVLVVGIVGLLQWAGYRFSGRADCTSSSINSLSDGTVHLLDGLDETVRITTAYFKTDIEEKDQAKYRSTAEDLVNLYQIENRSKIEVESFNPLQDHDKRKELLDRLQEKPKFHDQSAKHRELLDKFEDELVPEITTLLDAELTQMGGLGESLGGTSGTVLGQIEVLLNKLQRDLGATQAEIKDASQADLPQYGAAVSVMHSLCSNLSKRFKDIGTVGGQVAGDTNLSPTQADFLAGAQARYQPLVDKLDELIDAAAELPQLDLEDIARQLAPNSNPIIVETDSDAKVVSFRDVWPPVDQSAAASMAFKDRVFRGEEKLSAAILQLTQKEKTAVVFVRYGGSPLFMGGFMPGQPPAPFSQIKTHLEDLNFEVREWDLSTQTEPPEFDPAPAKTIYVVMKPSSPPQDPRMQQQQTPFGPQHSQAILDAIADSGRAVFLAGWYPGPFGPIPGSYEYAEHLKDTWGIEVEAGVLLLQARSPGPNQYTLRGDAPFMMEPSSADHPISKQLQFLRTILPYVCPLKLADTPPEGVDLKKLVWCERRDGLWGAKDVQAYVEQMREIYVQKVKGDLEGPFTVAAAASKDDAKVVVISARDFCADEMAFARDLAVTAEGLVVRSRNPGNLTLLVNTLHWLNDNEGIMGLGRPIDTATLDVAKGSFSWFFVRALVWAFWPILVVVGGLGVWYVRRR